MKNLNDLPSPANPGAGKQNVNKWRVSYHFSIEGSRGSRETHVTYRYLDKAKKEYRNTLRAFIKQGSQFEEYRICLNKTELEPWEDPLFHDENQKTPKPPKQQYREWKGGSDGE